VPITRSQTAFIFGLCGADFNTAVMLDFSFAIRRISARSSAGIGGRPGRDLRRQNNFHPARCQRINVCGRTTIKEAP
jgi:hypothetical protein